MVKHFVIAKKEFDKMNIIFLKKINKKIKLNHYG